MLLRFNLCIHTAWRCIVGAVELITRLNMKSFIYGFTQEVRWAICTSQTSTRSCVFVRRLEDSGFLLLFSVMHFALVNCWFEHYLQLARSKSGFRGYRRVHLAELWSLCVSKLHVHFLIWKLQNFSLHTRNAELQLEEFGYLQFQDQSKKKCELSTVSSGILHLEVALRSCLFWRLT